MKNKSLKAGLVAIAILNTFTPTPVNAGAKANALGLAGVVVSVGTGIAAGVVKGKTSKKFKTYQETQSAADQKAYESALNAYRWLTGIAVGTGVSTATGYGIFKYLVRCRINELLETAKTAELPAILARAEFVNDEMNAAQLKAYCTGMIGNAQIAKATAPDASAALARRIREADYLKTTEAGGARLLRTAVAESKVALMLALLECDTEVALPAAPNAPAVVECWDTGMNSDMQKALLNHIFADVTKTEAELSEADLLNRYGKAFQTISGPMLCKCIDKARTANNPAVYKRVAMLLNSATLLRSTLADDLERDGRSADNDPYMIQATNFGDPNLNFISFLLDINYPIHQKSLAPFRLLNKYADICKGGAAAEPSHKAQLRTVIKRFIKVAASENNNIGSEWSVGTTPGKSLLRVAQESLDAEVIRWVNDPASIVL